jgi:tRNA dimethylallyltransferase
MNNKTKQLPKLIVLLGATTSGKTDWSIRFAKAFDGEIISADSRQIYKKMDIGTAKISGEWRRNGIRKTFYSEDIPHHLIDFLDPGKSFTAAEFRDRAIKYAKFAHAHGKVPMLVGGTGLYISSVVDNWSFPRVPPNPKLRKGLESKTSEELIKLLQALDPVSAEVIDARNKRRMIRALEVSIFSGKPFSEQQKKGEPLFDLLQIGVEAPRAVLHERIHERVDGMVKRGLVKEVELLVKQRYGWHLPCMSGVGYQQFKGYFDGTYSLDRAIEILKRDTRRYARRQLTWFRRDKRIEWCTSYDDAFERAKIFLSL